MGALPGEGTTLRVPPTNQRFELFESLRAIAALSVLVFHTCGWSNVNLFTWYKAFTSKLNIGVTLFFLISGFLLYRPHAVEMLGGPDAPPAGDYVLRRAFRILPAYWVALTDCWASGPDSRASSRRTGGSTTACCSRIAQAGRLRGSVSPGVSPSRSPSTPFCRYWGWRSRGWAADWIFAAACDFSCSCSPHSRWAP